MRGVARCPWVIRVLGGGFLVNRKDWPLTVATAGPFSLSTFHCALPHYHRCNPHPPPPRRRKFFEH